MHGVSGVILLTHGLRLEYISPVARRLVHEFFGTGDGELPRELSNGLASGAGTLVWRRGSRRLLVDRSGDALLLQETMQLGLTPREREILGRVARGETNAEVAERLSISPTTVRKHLENIYAKLGVHTRTAAVARLRESADAAGYDAASST